MSNKLTPQQLLPTPQPSGLGPTLEVEDIQGDILIGLQKFFEQFAFFAIADVTLFKKGLREKLAGQVTTTKEVISREFQLRDHKNQGNTSRLPFIGLNVGFTQQGIAKLAPRVDLGDASFSQGAKSQAPLLNDPTNGGQLSSWLPPYLSDKIDGVFLITGGTEGAVDSALAKLQGMLGASISIVVVERGNTRPGLERGHEHFGWLDGVSQPGISGLTVPNPGQEVLDPGLFVFGYPPTAPIQPPAPAWVTNGSFMVFRRLKQLVPEFGQFLLTEAQTLGLDAVLLGARLVGRWKSGAPLALTPLQDDLAVGPDPSHNNDFDFSDDQAQRRCPFGAHIRKTNPRRDIPKDKLDPHRIIRAGIPFGPEVTEAETAANQTQVERGLLFVCYQTSIINQFEFVQKKWANNPDFVPGKNRPDGSGPVTVGIDPIIGQNPSPNRARQTDEPVPNYPTGNVRSTLKLPQDFIIPTAGAYFFMPSLSAIRNELTS